jgi:hypothetical protein
VLPFALLSVGALKLRSNMLVLAADGDYVVELWWVLSPSCDACNKRIRLPEKKFDILMGKEVNGILRYIPCAGTNP